MATTTARKRQTRPLSYYWDVVKDMDDSQKLELVTMLVESVKPAIKREQSDASIDYAEREQARPEVKPKMMAPPPMKRFTMDEINAMLDEAEADFAAGKGIPHEEVMREWDEELERWEQEELDESRLPQQELEMAEVV